VPEQPQPPTTVFALTIKSEAIVTKATKPEEKK
jgi:hypothetical protein